MPRRVVYYPSDKDFLNHLVKFIEPPSGAHLVDLGCGDGRVLHVFGRHYDDIRVTGVEIDPNLVRVARQKLSSIGDRAKVIKGDLFKENLERYDIIYAYLTRDALSHMRNKLIRFLYEGGLLVTHDYPVPGLEPSRVHLIDLGGKKHYIFLYFDKERVRRDLIKGLKI